MGFRTAQLPAVFLVVELLGCARVESPAPAGNDSFKQDASCDESTRFVAAMRNGSCEDVDARDGRWVAGPAFPDAPATDGMCAYGWSSEQGAPADGEALVASIGSRAVLTPVGCAETSVDAGLTPIESLTRPQHGVGAVGCDVCGVQQFGKLWLVLPKVLVQDREIIVGLSNGTERYFKFDAPDGARLLTLTLPQAPLGTEYVNGRVEVR